MRASVAASTILVFALSTVPASPVSAAGGVTVWHVNPTNRHAYGLTAPMTWLDAEQLAVRLGGHLVTINDQAEQDWLLAEFPDPYQWIGMNDRTSEGTWVWASGTRVTYTAWQDTQPDDWKGFDPLGEDAAVLTFPPDQPPGWVSISGRWQLGGIVEVPGRPKVLGGTQVEGFHDGTPVEVAVADECYANGWAFDPDSPKRDVTVRLLAQRIDITQVPIEVWRGPALEFREDLLQAGIGDGTAAFYVDLRPLIAYGVPYLMLAQARDVQTGEWFTLGASSRPLTCYPY